MSDSLERRRDLKKIRSALAEAGSDAVDGWDFVSEPRTLSMSEAEALAGVLSEVRDLKEREGIVRALTDAKTKKVTLEPLLDELERCLEDGKDLYNWAVGNALEIVARGKKEVFERLRKALGDERLGSGKETVTLALAKTGHPGAKDVLIQQLRDGIVVGHTIIGLRLLRAREAKDLITPYLQDKNAWIRREAKKALAIFERA